MAAVMVVIIFVGLLCAQAHFSVKWARERFAVEEGLRRKREAQRKRKKAPKPAAMTTKPRPQVVVQKPPEPDPGGWLVSDLTSALENLGFKGPTMRAAVDRVLLVGARTLDDAVRDALKILRPPARPATKSPATWVRASEYGVLHYQDERGETLGTVKRAGATWTWTTQRSSGHAGSRFEAQRAVEFRA